jgi:hypothetical protein
MKTILYVGQLWHGSTSKHRFSALERLGYRMLAVEDDISSPPNPFKNLFSKISNRLGYPSDVYFLNAKLLDIIEHESCDIIWIDKGLKIWPETLRKLKELGHFVIGYSPDDMGQSHCRSNYWLSGLKYYDHFVTTKTYNVPELIQMGAKNVVFVGNAYAPELHFPRPVTAENKLRFGGSVGFIGAYEKDRANYMDCLGRSGVKIRWWGSGEKIAKSHNRNIKKEKQFLWGEDYSTALSCFDINLCFLRKKNRDLQTTRSVEIPACGGFMLAERSAEHINLFEEGIEAEYFSSTEELIDKTKFYLANPKLRIQIALAGAEKCKKAGYSNDERLRQVLAEIFDPVLDQK